MVVEERSIAPQAPFTICARALMNTLRSKFLSFTRAIAYVARALAFMRFCGHINSPQISGHAHYSGATECDPNYCAMQRMYISTNISPNVLQRFVYLCKIDELF